MPGSRCEPGQSVADSQESYTFPKLLHTKYTFPKILRTVYTVLLLPRAQTPPFSSPYEWTPSSRSPGVDTVLQLPSARTLSSSPLKS